MCFKIHIKIGVRNEQWFFNTCKSDLKLLKSTKKHILINRLTRPLGNEIVFSNFRCTDKENEVWNACGTLCEPSCANPNPRFCPAIQCTGFDGCRCSPGFLRLSTGGPCVSPDQCNNTSS